MLRAISSSKKGRGGAILALLGLLWTTLWGVFQVWQAVDFLPSHLMWLWGVVNSPWGPIVLLVLGLIVMFQVVTARLPRIQELETQEQRREQEALDAYAAQMNRWLHDQNRPLRGLPQEDEVRTSAQEATLAILEKVGPEGKRRVMRYLHSQKLVEGENPIISLGDADLSGANLADMKLVGTNFKGANLSD
jgi:hypothetical protein